MWYKLANPGGTGHHTIDECFPSSFRLQCPGLNHVACHPLYLSHWALSHIVWFWEIDNFYSFKMWKPAERVKLYYFQHPHLLCRSPQWLGPPVWNCVSFTRNWHGLLSLRNGSLVVGLSRNNWLEQFRLVHLANQFDQLEFHSVFYLLKRVFEMGPFFVTLWTKVCEGSLQ